MVLVDNSLACMVPQLENGIPILPYYDDSLDRELLKLSDFLVYLARKKDVRPFLKGYFRLREFGKCDNADHVYQTLFVQKGAVDGEKKPKEEKGVGLEDYMVDLESEDSHIDALLR